MQISSSNITVGSISNCTFVGTSSGGPFSIGGTVSSPITINGCIFSSLIPTATVTAYAKGATTFNNCAFPKDGYPAESLNSTPLQTASVTNNSPTYVSPRYQKVLADYDWSNRQNNDGNDGVLRPGNSTAYTSAGMAGVPLTGGAGGHGSAGGAVGV